MYSIWKGSNNITRQKVSRGKEFEYGKAQGNFEEIFFPISAGTCANPPNSGLKERLEKFLLIQETYLRGAGRKALKKT